MRNRAEPGSTRHDRISCQVCLCYSSLQYSALSLLCFGGFGDGFIVSCPCLPSVWASSCHFSMASTSSSERSSPISRSDRWLVYRCLRDGYVNGWGPRLKGGQSPSFSSPRCSLRCVKPLDRALFGHEENVSRRCSFWKNACQRSRGAYLRSERC
jgi:hypothetical protein